MGKGAADQEGEKWNPETPSGEYNLAYDYRLGENPVTVAQFQIFVHDSGRRPDNPRSLDGKPNDPVVHVTWHDANAFCEWLTNRWRAKGWLPRGWRTALPSEPEWEKAARGGFRIPRVPRTAAVSVMALKAAGTNEHPDPIENPKPQRRYPWGDAMNDEFLNYGMKIGQVSTPGAFPLGKSPYGCLDLSGNVWEWTRSLYGGYPYPRTGTRDFLECETGDRDASRVLRGGAFYYDLRYVRSAVRGYYHPNYRDDRLGFRVCLSPLAAGNAGSPRCCPAKANGGVFSWPRLENRANSNGLNPCLSGLGLLYAQYGL